MVKPEQLEDWLTAVPTRQLPAELEQQLLSRIQQQTTARGWRRPIALWHGVAAAMLGLAVGWFGFGWTTQDATPPPIVVEMQTDWLATRASTASTGLNIGNWSPQRSYLTGATGEMP